MASGNLEELKTHLKKYNGILKGTSPLNTYLFFFVMYVNILENRPSEAIEYFLKNEQFFKDYPVENEYLYFFYLLYFKTVKLSENQLKTNTFKRNEIFIYRSDFVRICFKFANQLFVDFPSLAAEIYGELALLLSKKNPLMQPNAHNGWLAKARMDQFPPSFDKSIANLSLIQKFNYYSLCYLKRMSSEEITKVLSDIKKFFIRDETFGLWQTIFLNNYLIINPSPEKINEALKDLDETSFSLKDFFVKNLHNLQSAITNQAPFKVSASYVELNNSYFLVIRLD